MESNIKTRQALTEKQIIRNFAVLLANARKESGERGDLEANDRLERLEALFDHFIEVTVEQGVLATWLYKPLPVKVIQ